MQQDPLRGSLDQPCTLNRSTYAQANPTSKVDPSGLFTCSVSLGGSFSLPAGGGLSVGIGFDNSGGIGVFYAPQYGGNTTIGVSGGVSVALLNEPNISGLSGPFTYLGATVSLPSFGVFGVGGEAVWDPTLKTNGSFAGIQADVTAGKSIGKVPSMLLDVHGYQSVTSNVYALNDLQYFVLRSAIGPSPLGHILDLCQQTAAIGGFITKSAVLRQ
jgi:hypothetical protein